ncbi:MAG: inositol monophosphatase family protein [Planctomycetota bacterium]|nr:inositol monophosphatase family protein [Planctomycetota bacterium]
MDTVVYDAMHVGIEAAQAAGKILCDMLETATVREKAPKDLVTDADIAAQQCIESRILAAFPCHQFLGEECLQPNVIQAMTSNVEWLWVVDPLDGTVNYAHRMPNFAVSIALMHRGQAVLGIVLDPMAGELYVAILGQGATVNGRKLQSSTCTKLDSALIAASFPPQVQKDSIEIAQFVDILVHSQSVRRLGSAALNLCYVAQGRLDAYWAGFLKVWDVAAGALIATESGAILSRHDGKPHDPWGGELVVAGSEQLHRELRCRLQAVEQDAC